MNPSNLKYRLFKSGTLRVSCKGSRHVAWFGNKYYPTKEEDIPDRLKRFCQSCHIEDCANKKKEAVESES